MLQSLTHVTSLTVLGCDMSNYIVDMPHWYEEVVAHGNSLPSGIQAALKPSRHFAGFAPCPLFERIRVVVLVDISAPTLPTVTIN